MSVTLIPASGTYFLTYQVSVVLGDSFFFFALLLVFSCQFEVFNLQLYLLTSLVDKLKIGNSPSEYYCNIV